MFRKQEEILFEWIEPKAVAIQSARSLIKYYGLTIFLHIFIISTVILVILYFIFDYLYPPDPSFKLFNIFIRAWFWGIGFSAFGFLVYPWLLMFERTHYRITSERIKIVSIMSGGHSRFLKWHDLTGYILTESQTIPGQRDITLLTDGRPRIIHLPNNDLDEQIIQYIAGRLPVFQNIPTSTYPPRLTFLQKCCFGFCTVIYSFAIAHLLIVFSRAHYFHGNNDEFVPAIFTISALFLGPGTICSIGMFGWSFFKNIWFRTRAILINFMGFGLLILFWFILILWRLKKEGGW